MTEQNRKMKICFVLSYKDPNYIRSRSIIDSLSLINDVQLIVARNRTKCFLRYFDTLFQFIAILVRENPDVIIIGFRGHEIFWPIKLLSVGKKIIFDSLVSPYDVLKNEQKYGRLALLICPLVYLIERSILRHADVILTDTKLQKRYYQDTFNITADKLVPLCVGAQENFPPIMTKKTCGTNNFIVMFYGSFLSLHGIDCILQAAAHLSFLPIQFVLIGGRKYFSRQFRKRSNSNLPTNITHIDWLEYDALLRKISEADLCLGGPFGGTGQARRVITGKTYQCLALGKATVIGKIEEDAGFLDRVNCLLVEQQSTQALTESITWAYNNRQYLDRIGENGRALYLARFSAQKRKEILAEIL